MDAREIQLTLALQEPAKSLYKGAEAVVKDRVKRAFLAYHGIQTREDAEAALQPVEAATLAGRQEEARGARALETVAIAVEMEAGEEEGEVSMKWFDAFYEGAKAYRSKDARLLWARSLQREAAAPGTVPIRGAEVARRHGERRLCAVPEGGGAGLWGDGQA